MTLTSIVLDYEFVLHLWCSRGCDRDLFIDCFTCTICGDNDNDNDNDEDDDNNDHDTTTTMMTTTKSTTTTKSLSMTPTTLPTK